MQDEKIKLTFSQAVTVGLITGGVESFINLPLWTYKMRAQAGLARTFDPRILYRGLLPGMAVMSIMTSSQVAASSLAENVATDRCTETVSSTQRMFSAFAGGAASSLIFNPLDLNDVQYHKHEYKNYTSAVTNTFKIAGFRTYYRGILCTAMTDGMFTFAFWGCYPYLRNFLLKKMELKGYELHRSFVAASLLSGIATGLITSLTTQIPDTIKTLQHFEVDSEIGRSNSISSHLIRFWHSENAAVLSKAFFPRTVWLTSAVIAAGVVAEKIDDMSREFFTSSLNKR